MPQAQARVPTEKAGRYLVQLCKHFAHKVPAEWDERTGHVQFPPGTCRIAVEDGALQIFCEAESEEALATVKYIVEDHVVRFGFREKLTVDWTAPSGTP